MTIDEAKDFLTEFWRSTRDGSKASLALHMGIAALREKQERMSGCDWCIGFCPDVTGDPYADYKYCPMCGRPLKEEIE